MNFARSKIPSGGQEPPKIYKLYSAQAQETAKDRAKFGWPPVSDAAAVMKPRRETGLNLQGCPKPNPSQPWADVCHIARTSGGDIAV